MTRRTASMVLALLAGACFDPTQQHSADEGSSGGSSGADTTAGTTAGTVSTTASTTAGTTAGTTASTTATSADETQGPDTSADDATSSGGCGGGEACVPTIPPDWIGPLVVADACPPEFPSSDAVLNSGLVPGVPVCDCSCIVASVQCQLFFENNGVDFDPMGSCDDPPFDDECLSAIVVASCDQSFVDMPATASWSSTANACGGGTAGASCDGGTCFPDVAPLCIRHDGDQECPAGFDDRTVYFGGFDDTRACSGCNCTPSGQACEIDIEVCSVGFFDVTLFSGGECQQLNTSDGDGVTLLSTAIDDQGSCVAGSGDGQLSGDVVEASPITVCCTA